MVSCNIHLYSLISHILWNLLDLLFFAFIQLSVCKDTPVVDTVSEDAGSNTNQVLSVPSQRQTPPSSCPFVHQILPANKDAVQG